VVWLASVVSGLSVLGVGLAVGLAFALDHWAAVAPALGPAWRSWPDGAGL